MKSVLLILFTLAINTILVLSNEIDILLDNIVDYKQICNLHYNTDVTDQQISTWLSDGFNYIIKSVSTSSNNTLSTPEIRDELYDNF